MTKNFKTKFGRQLLMYLKLSVNILQREMRVPQFLNVFLTLILNIYDFEMIMRETKNQTVRG